MALAPAHRCPRRHPPADIPGRLPRPIPASHLPGSLHTLCPVPHASAAESPCAHEPDPATRSAIRVHAAHDRLCTRTSFPPRTRTRTRSANPRVRRPHTRACRVSSATLISSNLRQGNRPAFPAAHPHPEMSPLPTLAPCRRISIYQDSPSRSPPAIVASAARRLCQCSPRRGLCLSYVALLSQPVSCPSRRRHHR